MKHLATKILSLGLLAPLATAQETWPNTGLPVDDPVVAAIEAEADNNGQVMEILDELANGIGPRLTSSTNLTDACHWAADKFREWGLENVQVVEWGTFPVGFDRGLQRGRIVHPLKKQLTFATNAWTAGTDGPVRGRIVKAPTNDEDMEALRGMLKGAWVMTSGTTIRFDSDEDSFRARLGHFLDEEQIAGVIRPSRNDLVRTGGRYKVSMDALPHRVSVNLLRDDAKLIGNLLSEGAAVEVEFDIDNRFVEGPIPLYNVIGEIPGTEFPDELVIMGGHIDSWDGATGTQDNGTGTSTTMEAARLLATVGAKPRRTIRFMLWSGEEQGLLGSRNYIEQHPEENDRISACIVHDGGTNALTGITATPAMYPLLKEALEPLARMTESYEESEDGSQITFRVTERDGLPRGIGSDHDAYLSAGVPGFFWGQQGRASYQFVHHTQNDIYDNAVAEYQRHNAKVVAIGAWRVASLPEMLPRQGLTGAPPKRLGVFLGEDGVTVERLTESGLAGKAGVKPKDKLVQLGEQTIKSQSDLRRAIRAEGDRKTLVIERQGERLAFFIDWKAGESGPLKEVPAESAETQTR